MKRKSEPTTILTWVDTVGCYYTDQDGASWATVHCTGGLICDDCGKTFFAGYTRSALAGPARYLCGCQVKAKYPRRKSKAG